MAIRLHHSGTLSHSEQILFDNFSQGLRMKPPFSLIHEAFENTTDNQPSDVAVEHDGEYLTYRELDHSANLLANQLMSQGLTPNQKVCLVVHRSLPMVIAIIAILKCGCQYVPLDGGVLPNSLLSHVFENTQTPFILCLDKFIAKVQDCNTTAEVVILNASTVVRDQAASVRPSTRVAPHDGAYVIYTSGTTGMPKGVEVTHANVTNLLCLSPGSLGITRGTNVPQLLSVAFDMGQWEILSTLLNGGTLLLRTSNWDAVLKRSHTLIVTPSILGTLRKSDLPNIRVVALAGEPCPKELADEWAEDVTMYIGCGPTEVTIVNTINQHQRGHCMSIGRPVPNTNVYVLDEDQNPLPPGNVGIMWAGGSCVSRGYIGLPDLTARKYKYDEFINDGTSMMFNTGDLGRWLKDGTLEHHGRIDDQVKIKGFRVELDGVSAAIEKTQGVTRACALLKDTILLGFYSGPSVISEQELETVVKRHQPYYAVPTKWVFQPSLPLTTNGKIDRKALSDLAVKPVMREHIPEHAINNDVKVTEKALVQTSVQPVEEKSNASTSSLSLKEPQLPEKHGRHGLRAFRHRILSLYRRFFSLVLFINIIGLIIAFLFAGHLKLSHLATGISTNLTASVLFRQDHVVNLLFTLACSVPTSWPLYIRRNCAKVYHIGGLHSGFGLSSAIWLIAFTVLATEQRAATAVLVITYLLDALLITIIILAHPTFRAKFHDYFELTHRFAGWSALALFWIHTVLFANSTHDSLHLTLGEAVVQSPGFWLLFVATSSVALPWLNLRRVPVHPEVLSGHAIRLHFAYTTPVVGTAVRISERPLLEWHAFATIAKPEEKGFSLLVSNAGDWTKRQIGRAPEKLWVRGVPACGVLRIAPLFKKVVLVATGSGIGPCLPVIYARKVPARVLWSTPWPEKTFGDEIIRAIKAADKDAVIWDTKAKGRPDMVALSYKLYVESGAEAVCVISNKKFTQMIVYAMEARGIPAFGAIFDS